MNILGSLLGKLVGGNAGQAVVEYFDSKQKLKQQLALTKLQGKIDVEKAKAAQQAAQLQSDTQLSQTQLTSAGNSIRQDWVLALLSIPMIMAFIPKLQPYVEAGFKALDQCPGWYKYTGLTVMLAIYGVRQIKAGLFK
ncbi:MAG TPA: hypothetical protein VFY39_04580 [Gammaproteobacteria bacterium]|nr:hypothetical protein [Gammaproteobacteria bacterium]